MISDEQASRIASEDDKHEMDVMASFAVAQGWCEPEVSGYEMDAVLAGAIAKPVGRALRAWYDTAAQHARNEEFYRELLVKCGEIIGHSAYVCDDGSVSEDVLCAKILQLVDELLAKTYRIDQ